MLVVETIQRRESLLETIHCRESLLETIQRRESLLETVQRIPLTVPQLMALVRLMEARGHTQGR